MCALHGFDLGPGARAWLISHMYVYIYAHSICWISHPHSHTHTHIHHYDCIHARLRALRFSDIITCVCVSGWVDAVSKIPKMPIATSDVEHYKWLGERACRVSVCAKARTRQIKNDKQTCCLHARLCVCVFCECV